MPGANLEPDNHTDWIELVVKIGGALGFNPVRLRWKLMAWREKAGQTRRQAQVTVHHLGYAHRICPSCHTVQDRSNKVCANCGASLSPRFVEVLRRLGLAAPHVKSVSSLLMLAIGIVYGAMILYQGGGGVMGFQGQTLLHFGAHYPPLVWHGEWWRLSTYIFLHVGLLHLAFNLIALQMIGPQVEELFGRGRMLFFFMVTGILAALGSEVLGLQAPSAGASGALMGLIGVAAGWGQRDGTTIGKDVRNRMVTWGVYTLVFGFMVHADNGAHFAGFASGAVLGFFAKPEWEAQRSGGKRTLHRLMGWVGALLALGTLFLVLFPPHSILDLPG